MKHPVNFTMVSFIFVNSVSLEVTFFLEIRSLNCAAPMLSLTHSVAVSSTGLK